MVFKIKLHIWRISLQLRVYLEKQHHLQTPFNKRFGGEFFKRIPTQSGVFWLLDSRRNVLLMDTGINIQQKLLVYKHFIPTYCEKNASPLIHEIHDIKWSLCPDYNSTQNLYRELLKKIKPAYEKLNVKNENYFFIQIARVDSNIHFNLTKKLLPHFSTYGSFRGRIVTQQAYSSLLRLLHFSFYNQPLTEWPLTLSRTTAPREYSIQYPESFSETGQLSWDQSLNDFLNGENNSLSKKVSLLEQKRKTQLDHFTHSLIVKDLKNLAKFYDQVCVKNAQFRKKMKLGSYIIDPEWLDAIDPLLKSI